MHDIGEAYSVKNFYKKILFVTMACTILFMSYIHSYTPKHEIYDLNETLMHQIESHVPDYVSLDEVSQDLINATVAMEDKRFYRHIGVDPIAIVRAVLVDIRERRYVQGGSTITQQLAKNLFLNHKKSLNRKFQELIIASKLEQLFTKEEILEMYLNVIYYGSGAYGIGEACEIYFDKTPGELSLEESAMLVGIPPSPNRYNPIRNLAKAKQRQEVVLSVMAKKGYLN